MRSFFQTPMAPCALPENVSHLSFVVKKLINFKDDKVMRLKAVDDVLKWLWHGERHKEALVGKNRFGSGGVDQGAAVEGFELDQERGSDEVGIEDL